MDQLYYVERGLKPKTWYVEIAANANTEYFVRVKMNTVIKNIIGVRCYTAGVSPNNTSLMALAQVDEYFLTMISLSGGFIFDRMRLDIFWYGSSTNSISSAHSYMPCNVRGQDVDLPRSIIKNPGAA